ncbi:thioesterase [Streptomyces spiroverticillatus]|uniref:Thioesterase n=1 Tax=Streptomyces finlayi TaxID=67296 RepID=A0A919CG57_9ACTN|nr:alpha/beta fold hydrolase [Streptomyces finlayi]GHA44042.1 thioesterase [Streptomyces spiroverticillatus]GHD17587.1 thioesterase [Streptomyces finlayi]
MSHFVRPRDLTRPAVRLVAFHHAGGSAASYFPLSRYLPADWDVLLLDLPGRGKRHAQPALADMREVVAAATDDVRPLADGTPLAFFGHSFGAVVAFETARALEARGDGPFWVGVSGRGAPGHEVLTRLPDHAGPDAELIARLREMGGMPERLDAVPEFRDRFLRLVRCDLRAVADYRPDAHRPPLAASLTAFGATHDSWAPIASMAAWARQTRGPFTERTYDGGHFHFLGSAFEAFAADLVDEVSAALPLWSVASASSLRTSTSVRTSA